MNCRPSCRPALFWLLLPSKLNLYPELRESRSFPARLNTQGSLRGASRLGHCSRLCFEHPCAAAAGTAYLPRDNPSTSLPPAIDTRAFRPRSCKQTGKGSAHEDVPIPTASHSAGCTLHQFEVFTSTLTAFRSRRLRMDPSKCLMNT